MTNFPVHFASGAHPEDYQGIILTPATGWCFAFTLAWLAIGFVVWKRDKNWSVLAELVMCGMWICASVGSYASETHAVYNGAAVDFKWNLWPFLPIAALWVAYAVVNKNNYAALYKLVQWPPSRAFPVIVIAHWTADLVNGYVSIRSISHGFSILGGDKFVDGLFIQQSVMLSLYALAWYTVAVRYIEQMQPNIHGPRLPRPYLPLTDTGWKLLSEVLPK